MFEDFRIRIFLTVAAEENFTRAAEKLGITQPAVSQNIAELEKAFNVKLFERKRGCFALTAEGRVLRIFAERLDRCYRDLETLFLNFGTVTKTESIRISLSENLLGTLPQRILPYLNTICPGASVLITAGNDPSADIMIIEEGGVRSFRPSASFALNPICGLLRNELFGR